MPLGEYQEYKRYFDLVTFIILMLVPATVSIVAIITIGIAQREKTFSQFGNGVTKKTIKHEKKFVTALYRYNVADSIFYTICLSPTRSLEIFGPYASTWVVENILTWMIYVSRVLLVSYFACTPILYSLFFDMKIRKKKATDPNSSYSTSATLNEDEEDENDDSSEGDDPIEPELDCRCNSKPKNCSSCNSKCLAINGRRVSMEFTCPETGFTQTFTNQKCNRIRKMNMSENCGTLSCACAAELTVAETGKGTKFECTAAKKKPTYRVYCDANNDNRFNLGETNQERKVKCKRGAIKRNPFNLQC
ncbi:Oidioi.mRNA.OKI2018_I69.chr1.g1358.t1.cds [Oikopleura dioica]|uniref:Oidioi.mRNA.OKI2018_I69.chr1.g1358.t1.cds n=1 Tax=Oikopleura dioica TaxID=34765 RepID=A0ABN7SPC2_OIKDI|nr:Oidioi.mRNA.OKI2018_I69.chr1.g1358.t1.cds [Oikopleura dioica]